MSTEHSHHHGGADDGAVHVHVHPASTYYKVFVAVAIATIKAALVASFFMHLKDDNRFNVLIFIGSLIFMGVFFVYTMNDTEYRGQWDGAQGTQISPETGEAAPGRGLSEEIRLSTDGKEHGGEH